MKTKSLLFLAFILIVATFTLASCDAVGGVVDKIGDLPVIGDLPFFADETTTAAVTTTAPADVTTAPADVTTTAAPDVTTAPAVTTTAAPVTTTAPITTTAPVDPFKDFAIADGEFTYDGEAKALAAVGAPEGAVITYAYEKDGAVVDAAIDAGTYTVTATVSYNGESKTKTATLVINKKAVAVGATFENGTAVYTGEAMTYEAATGFDADLFTVAYTYSADMINVGEYVVTATFALIDDANYVIEGEATATASFVITKAPIDLSAVAFPATENKYFTGEAFIFEVENLPEGVEVAYTYVLNGEAVESLYAVGTYTVTATFTSANYEIAADSAITAEFTILNVLADMSSIVLNDLTLVYNGSLQAYEIVGLPAGIDAELSYTQNGLAANPQNVGTYDVLIKFSSVGYTIPEEWTMKTAVLNIAPQKVNINDVIFEGGAYTYDTTVKTYKPATGYDATIFNVTYAIEGDAVNAGSFTATATFSLVDSVNYEIEGAYTLTATYTIAKAKVQIGTLADGSAEYDGSAKKHEAAAGYDANLFTVEYAYSGDMINAGTYDVTATFILKDEANYEIDGPASVSAKFVIDPKPVSLEGIVLAGNSSLVYDGNEKAYTEAANVNADIFDVVYSVEGSRVNAGEFIVTATFTVKNANYVLTGNNALTATYVIAKADIDLEGVAFPEENLGVYNGTPYVYEIVLPEGLTASYEYSGNMTDAGTYTVTATITKDSNYNVATMVAEFKVAPKSVNVDDVTLKFNVAGADAFGTNYAYEFKEGETYQMTLVDGILPEGVVATYTTIKLAEYAFEADKEVDNAVTECGSYKTIVCFTAANANYQFDGVTTESYIVWGVYAENWSAPVK